MQYGFKQIVQASTRDEAILDKIWTNIDMFYNPPQVLPTLGTSDHRMVLLSPNYVDKGEVHCNTTRCTGQNEKAIVASTIRNFRWEDLYMAASCQEQFEIFQHRIATIMNLCFPLKVSRSHSTYKPLINDSFRELIRQNAQSLGNDSQYRLYRNKVNRATKYLSQNFYKKKVASTENSSSRDWWRHMKTLMGLSSSGDGAMQGLANRHCQGDIEALANEFFASVSGELPPIEHDHPVFNIAEPIPAEYTITVEMVDEALSIVKINKAAGTDGIPPWISAGWPISSHL